MDIAEKIETMLSKSADSSNLSEARTDLDKALDVEGMPKGKNWMSISPAVIEQLAGREAKKVLKELVRGGQDIHQEFYNALESAVGTRDAVAMVERAKKK